MLKVKILWEVEWEKKWYAILDSLENLKQAIKNKENILAFVWSELPKDKNVPVTQILKPYKGEDLFDILDKEFANRKLWIALTTYPDTMYSLLSIVGDNENKETMYLIAQVYIPQEELEVIEEN